MAFDFKDVRQFMDFRASESALGSQGVISSEQPNLEINIFHTSYTIIFHPFLFHFLYFLYRSARNKGNMNATGRGFEVKDVMQVMDFMVFVSALEN